MQEEHLIRADVSRKMYRKDTENNKDPSEGYYSMDMQKIINAITHAGNKDGPHHQTNIDDQLTDFTHWRGKTQKWWGCG